MGTPHCAPVIVDDEPLRSGRFRQWGREVRSRFERESLIGETEGNTVKLFYDADMVYGSQLAAIGAAKKQVLMEMYMFESDEVGWMFAEALAEAAGRGVQCKVIYDAVGSSNAEEDMFRMMRDVGIEVVEFRPLAPWRKGSKWLGRDHRKVICIDGNVGFAGGVNLGRPWSRSIYGDDAWRDTHMRLTGPVVSHLQELMAEVWEVATGRELYLEPNTTGPTGPCDCKVVGGRGLRSRSTIKKTLIEKLRTAEKRVEITTPYFMPTRKLHAALLHTAKRGVEVHIISPSVSDMLIADVTKEGLYQRMLDAGIKIWEYCGPVMHAKSMVIDSRIAIVGSSNLDFLSLAMNREMLVLMQDEEIVKDLELQFIDDTMLANRVRDGWKEEKSWIRRTMSRVLSNILRRLF